MRWHAMPLSEIFEALQSSPLGLSSTEAQRRLQKYGKNVIESERRINPLKIFLKQFSDFLVLILIAAALISFAMSLMPGGSEHAIDAVLITIILFANAIIGFFQEYRAEQSILALKKLAAPAAKVLRDGMEKGIAAELVVPGDIIVLEQGDKVPADARLIEQANLQVDESMLTGESMPVSKKEGVLEKDVPLAERKNMLFMNTLVTRGRAKAVVVGTGTNTEVGKIAKLLAETEEKPTPFQIELNRLGKTIGIAIVFIIAFVAITQHIVINDSPIEIFLRAVSLAVAAVPEGLPAVVTIALTIGIKRMAKKKALARSLPVAESLGSVNVICTDKTGTLTENVMTVRRMFFNMQEYLVTGEGLSTKGEFYIGDRKTLGEELRTLLECGILCNDAKQYSEGNRIKYTGDPTEIALLVTAKKAGLDVEIVRAKQPRVHEVAFSSERKMMTAVCIKDGRRIAYVKGAPEVVLERCNRILLNGEIVTLSDELREKVLEANFEMGKNAWCVLTFAFKED
ncbi:MAG: HAD-IC family P-type ATPase, partial [Candidatus Diapherotrites archaeon]|nr:HAD-IC family P-type ATPase [Candidatus Diapherotrites archaeon]